MGSNYNILRNAVINLALASRIENSVINEEEVLAREALHRVWNPPGVWKKFIAGQGI